MSGGLTLDREAEANADGTSAEAPPATATGISGSVLALQCVSSTALTVLGFLLGPTPSARLIASVVGAALGTFLTAPGRHHGRRVVAVTLVLMLLDAAKSLAATIRHPRRPHAKKGSAASAPSRGRNWIASALGRLTAESLAVLSAIAVAGFGAGWGAVAVAHAANSGAKLALVPTVNGRVATSASADLSASGFRATATEGFSNTVAVGRVISTNPAGGTRARKGSSVMMLVSKGRSRRSLIAVPNVAGLTKKAAFAALAGAGFTSAATWQLSATVPAGVVVASDPADGVEALKGSRVTVVVSSGSSGTQTQTGSTVTTTGSNSGSLVAVPDVDGLSETAAFASLRTAGFTSAATWHPSATVAHGLVISADPAEGTRAEKGTRVTVVVSSGPQNTDVRVPDVDGWSITRAEAVLGQDGFKATQSSAQSATVAEGDVISTNPVGGTEAPRGSPVTVVVSTGLPPPPDVPVPNVVGDTEGSAQSALTGAGLKPATESQQSATVPEGDVISTSPGAGTKVPPGALVTVTVSSGSPIE
jgi:beta-lactam-binding protein with PASTA domain